MIMMVMAVVEGDSDGSNKRQWRRGGGGIVVAVTELWQWVQAVTMVVSPIAQ